MHNRPAEINYNEYKSIRYLNLFRLLIGLFFFSIIFKGFGNVVGFSYTLDIAKFIASNYLTIAILTWIASVLFKKQSITIGLIALIVDLPFIIALTLLFDDLNQALVILPVITIGSYSMLSRRPLAILAMPIFATVLLWLIPQALKLPMEVFNSSSGLLYATTYFGIALVGIRQSQNYNHFVHLAQKQEKRITNLSLINRLIIDQMGPGVIAFNNDYKVIMINKKAKELLKIVRNEILPKLLIKKIVGTKESEHKSVTIYGEEVLIHLIKRDKSSNLHLLFIEEQKQINDKAQQINLASLGQLSAVIAHELRNPMASIYNASQLLQEAPDINDEDKAMTDIIIKQVERSNNIIENILLMSKPHIANQIKINLCEKLANLQKQFCDKHSLESSQFILNCSNESLIINFDETHLNQVFWNLAENAQRHGENGNLAIHVSYQEKFILIDFLNEGPEFEPIVEESIFTPFFTTHTQGTGLGLYICREICKSNNAKLEYLRQDFKHVFRIHIKH